MKLDAGWLMLAVLLLPFRPSAAETFIDCTTKCTEVEAACKGDCGSKPGPAACLVRCTNESDACDKRCAENQKTEPKTPVQKEGVSFHNAPTMRLSLDERKENRPGYACSPAPCTDKPGVVSSSGRGCNGNACRSLRFGKAPDGCITVTNTSQQSIQVTMYSSRGGSGKSLRGGATSTFNWMGTHCITAEIYTGADGHFD